MKNTCSCGNVFEFSEKSIGQKVICQKCQLEIVLKDSSQTIGTPVVKFSPQKIFKWFGIYILCLGIIFVGLLFYDREVYADFILTQTKHSASVTGDNLERQAEKVLNQVNAVYPKCTGKWTIQNASTKGEWLVLYRVYKRNGYILHEARFQVLLADELVVSPLDELAIEIQGDLDAHQRFLWAAQEKKRIPHVNFRETGDTITRLKEEMERKERLLPGYPLKKD